MVSDHRAAHKSGLSHTAWIVVAAALFVCARPASASKSLFTDTGSICTEVAHCWEAGDFGVLVGLYNATTTSWSAATVNYNNSTINGEIGVGSGSKLTFSGNGDRTWTGPIDFADALNSSSGYCGATGTTACSVPTGNTLQNGSNKEVRVTGGTEQAASQIMTALNQMRRISDYWANTWDDTPGNNVVSLGTTLGTSVTTLGAAGQVKVYSATTVATTKDLVITGDANSMVIINITGSSSNATIPVQFKNNISLSGGITADQVFFNILGTASSTYVMQATTSGKILNGVFYAAADSYTVGTQFGGTSAGQGARLFGAPGTSAWGANFTLNAPPDVSTPEPSTYFLMAAGLGAFGYLKRRSRPRA
jgi:hypothetical protein